MPEVVEERSGPFRVTLTDGSYFLWDKKDGLFRVAFYARRTSREFHLRDALALAARKPTHGPLVDIVMKFIEERDEYAAAISSPKKVVQ